MGKQVNFLFGIILALVIISFSISSAYATETISTIPFSSIPWDVAVDTNDRIIVALAIENSIAVFDANGNLEFTITNNTFSNFGIQRVATDSNNRIIAEDVLAKNIYIFDSFGNFEKKFSIQGIGDIATDSTNRIIVIDNSQRSIQVFDSNGNPDISIIGSPLVNPLSVTTDSNDRIIVGDDGNDESIHIFDKFGTLEFSITPVQSIYSNDIGEDIFYRHAFLDRPISIATDSSDRIIVADTNQYGNVIHVFDKDGNYESISKIDQTNLLWTAVFKNFPEISSLIEIFDWGSITGIAIDSNDRVIVSTHAKYVNIIKFSQASTGDSCSNDCTPPDLEFFQVNKSSNWLSANDSTFKIGDEQVIKFRYSDNRGIHNIREVELGFGLPTNYSPMWKAETILKINTDSEVIKSFEIKDDNHLFVDKSITLKVDKVNCISDFCSELEYTLGFIWKERPFDGYFLITGADYNGNISFDRSVNEFKVIGETQYEQPALEMYNRYTSTTTDELFIQLTRIDKILDIWIDETDRKWRHLGNNQFELITR